MKCFNCNATTATPLLMCPATAQCGTPFKAQSLPWKKPEPTAAYVDKVFSAHRAEGSSIFYPLATADLGENITTVYELTSCAGGCCCQTNTLSPDAVFEIQNSYVQLDCLSVAEAAPATITPDMVTVNGETVNDVTQSSGLFVANISNLITELTNPACLAQGLPSQAYLLLQNIPGLQMRVRLGFEGVVRSGGVLYRFKLYMANNEAIPLLQGTTTSFAVASVNIPCIENGMIPAITFRFDGTADVINPVLSVTEDNDTNEVTVNLNCTLGITPLAYVEVVRRTLMMVTAAEPADCASCGLDGFRMFAGTACCGAQDPTGTNRDSGIIRCNTCPGARREN